MAGQAREDAELMQLQKTVASQRHVIQTETNVAASQTWLKPQLETAEGTKQVYSMMERVVAGPSFLQKLTMASTRSQKVSTTQVLGKETRNKPDVTQPEFWEDVTAPHEDSQNNTVDHLQDADYEKVVIEQQPTVEALDSYVVVEKQDVLEAIGTFVAAYLVTLPEAQNMKPAELQAAVKRAFKELQQSRLRRFWGWGRCIYRCVAFSYGAFSVYENPWIVRAVLAAMWTASKLMFGLLV